MKLNNCIQIFVCVFATTKSLAFRNDGSIEWDDNAEFGRPAKRALKTKSNDVSDSERLYRELLEANVMEMSMSMSMDYSADTAKTPPPTGSPTMPAGANTATTLAPTGPPTLASTTIEESTNPLLEDGCAEGLQDAVAILLEVDTAAGKAEIEANVADALTTALSDEYVVCGSRRLEEGGSGNKNVRLGNITVVKEPAETCSPEAVAADSCYVVSANMFVSGDASYLRNSLAFIFANDSAFTEDLPAVGVMEVRLRDTDGGSEVNSPPEEPGNGSKPIRSAVAAILATAGISILAGIAYRALRNKDREAKLSENDTESEGNTSGSHSSA
eukprot:scaffold42_cov133-Cylindrotheca_fusiformis.AAC.3